jgi:hypothetical protein
MVSGPRKKLKQIENKKEKKKEKRNEIRKIVTLGFMQVINGFVNATDKDNDFSMKLFMNSSKMDNTGQHGLHEFAGR